jgi:anaphase-promoting complex subunit 2
MLESYAGKYFVLKAPRKLKWRRLQGNVELALTIGDKVVEYTVSPILATLLYHFQVGHECRCYNCF